jgi:hypothetical protein
MRTEQKPLGSGFGLQTTTEGTWNNEQRAIVALVALAGLAGLIAIGGPIRTADELQGPINNRP